jgi:hypothetical protein
MAEIANLLAVAVSYLIGGVGAAASYSKFQTGSAGTLALAFGSIGMLILATVILIRCWKIDRASKNVSV